MVNSIKHTSMPFLEKHIQDRHNKHIYRKHMTSHYTWKSILGDTLCSDDGQLSHRVQLSLHWLIFSTIKMN